MTNRSVWVERDTERRIVRIFHTRKCEAFEKADAEGRTGTCPRFDATREIREAIFKRCGGHCEICGRPITHSGPLWRRMHMHETLPRGKRGPDGHYGDVSLDNSVAACSRCHKQEHAEREPRFGETSECLISNADTV